MNNLLLEYNELAKEIGKVYSYNCYRDPYFIARWINKEWSIAVNVGEWDNGISIDSLEFSGADLLEILTKNIQIYRDCYAISCEINKLQETLNKIGFVLHFYCERMGFIAKTDEWGIFRPVNAVYEFDIAINGVEYYSFLVFLRDKIKDFIKEKNE